VLSSPAADVSAFPLLRVFGRVVNHANFIGRFTSSFSSAGCGTARQAAERLYRVPMDASLLGGETGEGKGRERGL
jgi:hypothetical protein